jgi:Metallo-peptidase family M12B Reprolysin-like
MRLHRPLLAAIASLALLPGTAAAQVTWPGGTPADDPEVACIEPVPASTSVNGVTDQGQQVQLATRVLLDGVTQAKAQEAMTRAADSYAPLGVTLTATYETVSFSGDDAQGLIDQAKSRFGGGRPAGSDLVYVLTGKDIQAGGNTGVAGLADCIGGVRFADRAFAVGEVFEEDLPIGPLTFYADATAKIAAHELGHLMGGHHHYANCAEGVKSEQEVLEGSPCTLMSNFVDFQSIHFSSVNGPVVRGHAISFASP